MTRYLLIAGHGKQPNGSFDPGARNLISKGEHRYFAEDFFPLMQKYTPDHVNAVYHTEWDVFGYRNTSNDLNGLVKKHKADAVIEFHLDSFNADYRGGHVIVWHEFQPDALDLRLRDTIGRHVPLRLSHYGQKGISGRNLHNARESRNHRINYRLLELGNTQNKEDVNVLTENIEAYAKDMALAIFGSVKKETVTSSPKKEPVQQPKASTGKSIAQMAKEVYQGKHGNGVANRRQSLGVDRATYDKVQDYVNKHYYGIQSTKTTQSVNIDDLARRTFAGEFGNGEARRKALGKHYDRVQKRVNELYYS